MFSKQNAPKVDQTTKFRREMLSRKSRKQHIKRLIWSTGLVLAICIWSFVAYAYLFDHVK